MHTDVTGHIRATGPTRIVAPLLAFVFAFIPLSAVQAETLEILSPVYEVDGVYRSMEGPYTVRKMMLLEQQKPELIWVTGYRATMVAPDGKTPMSQEFMCHSNLDVDMEQHRQRFGWKKHAAGRLFTLSQGQFEVNFPEGFGVPMYSDEVLSLVTQVLNLNPQPDTLETRHKVNIDFVRDSELKAPIKALFMTAANGLVSLDKNPGYYNIMQGQPELHGQGCMVGEASSSKWSDQFGHNFSSHWIVKPGREINHTLVTPIMNLPFDTKVHYIAVHLHPFAESLELKDLTTGESVFKSHVLNSKGRTGLDKVDYFTSKKGVQLYKDHQYEMISVYNNTSGVEQDSMAVMYLYVEDHEFDRAALNRQPIPDIALNSEISNVGEYK